MLDLRPSCEHCDIDLPPESPDARICTYECTWCARCAVDVLQGVCPNCSGNFVPRPIRPAAMLALHPASTVRVHAPVDLVAHAERVAKVRGATTEPFAGVVLTGGASSRMGSDKAFVEIGGRPLVLRVSDALEQAGASRVAAIGGDTERLRSIGVDARPDRQPGQGPLGGIVTALEELDADLLVVAACDLVSLTASAVREVLAALTSDADAVIPRSDRLEPLMAAYRRRCLSHLRDELDAGERAPHRAVEGLAVVQVRLVESNALRDADSPDDLPIA